MTVGMFTPRSPDGRAEYRIVAALIQGLRPDDVVTYEQLGAALNRDPVRERHSIYIAVAKASRWIRREDRRSLACVRKVGYRVLRAVEHKDQAALYARQAERRIEVGLEVMHAARLEEMTPQQREIHIAQTVSQASVLQWMRYQSVRTDRTEEQLLVHQEQLREAARRLDRLEGTKESD